MVKYKIYTMMTLSLALILMMEIKKVMTTKKMIMIQWNMMKKFNVNMEFSVMMDEKSLIFSYTVLMITTMIMLYSKNYFKETKINNIFMKIMSYFVASMILLILSSNMISLILSWEGLGMTSFILIMIYKNKKSMKSAFFTIMANRLGDIMLIMSIAIMMKTNSWHYESFPMTTSFKESPMILMAAFSKSAQIPFSSWLTEAMAAPTPISALVHSSTLVTAGVYLMMRSEMMMSNQTMKTLTMMTSVLTLFMAATNSMMETDLKKIIALSTMMQMSMMFLMIAVKMKEVAFLHLIIHAMFKAMIFMAASSMIKTFETQDIRKMSQMSKLMPTTALSFNISNMSMCGLMYTSGFYSKDMIMEESLNEKMAMTILTMEMISVICSVIYSIKMMLMTNLMMHNTVKITNKKEKLPTKTVNIFMTTHAVIMGNKMFWMTEYNNSIHMHSLMQKLTPMLLIMMAINITKNIMQMNKKNNFTTTMINYMVFSKIYTTHMKNKYMMKITKMLKMTEKGMQEMLILKMKTKVKMHKENKNLTMRTTKTIMVAIMMMIMLSI